jgi:respiratory burst oxidase
MLGQPGIGPPPLAMTFKSPSMDGKRRHTRFKDEDEFVEVMLDARDGGDALAVRNVKGVHGDT